MGGRLISGETRLWIVKQTTKKEWEDEKGRTVSRAYGSALLGLRRRGAGPATDPNAENPGSLHSRLRRQRAEPGCGGQRARPRERPSGEVRLHRRHRGLRRRLPERTSTPEGGGRPEGRLRRAGPGGKGRRSDGALGHRQDRC